MALCLPYLGRNFHGLRLFCFVLLCKLLNPGTQSRMLWGERDGFISWSSIAQHLQAFNHSLHYTTGWWDMHVNHITDHVNHMIHAFVLYMLNLAQSPRRQPCTANTAPFSIMKMHFSSTGTRNMLASNNVNEFSIISLSGLQSRKQWKEDSVYASRGVSASMMFHIVCQ